MAGASPGPTTSIQRPSSELLLQLGRYTLGLGNQPVPVQPRHDYSTYKRRRDFDDLCHKPSFIYRAITRSFNRPIPQSPNQKATPGSFGILPSNKSTALGVARTCVNDRSDRPGRVLRVSR